MGHELLARIREQRILAARECPNAFVELVGIDASKPEAPPMVQHDIHIGMQRDISDNPRVVFMTSPGIGKSSQLILRIVWEIGRNPNIRVVICSKTKNKEETGSSIFLAVREYLENPLVREVFPHLARGSIWQDKQLVVKRSSIDANPTVKVGAAGHFMKGARIDLLVLDDWYDERSCAIPSERKALLRWFWAIQDRLSEDARVVACCNAIHPDDPGHHIERRAMERPEKFKWLVRRIPVYQPPDYDIDLDKVVPTIPEFYPVERIRSIRNSIPQIEFQRLYLCNAVDETASVFDHQTVHRAFRSPDEPEGLGVGTYDRLSLRDQAELGCHVVVGVDLAAKTHSKADRTVLTAVIYWPRDDIRQVIWIESGRWRSDEVAKRIIEWDRRFRPTHIMVETSGQQSMMLGAIRLALDLERSRVGPGVSVPTPPVRGFTTTGSNKWDLTSGVESIATELQAERWLFPALPSDGGCPIHEDAVLLKNSLLHYIRGAHTGDHLMSLWLASQGIRLIAYREDEEVVEDRKDQELERAVDRIADLVRRTGVRYDRPVEDVESALQAYAALVDAGVPMHGYEDDLYALTEFLEPEREDDYPDPEESFVRPF